MAKRIALGFLTVAPFVVLALFLLVPDGATAVLAAVVMSFPVALVTLAVAREGRVGRLRAPLAAVFVMLQVGALGVLGSTGSGTNGPFALPLSLHFLLILVWLGPLCVTTMSYALLFPELGIDDELLERLARMRRDKPDGLE